jgi:hypothetical protein
MKRRAKTPAEECARRLGLTEMVEVHVPPGMEDRCITVVLASDELDALGYREGSRLLVEVGAEPKPGELAAVHTRDSGLLVCHYRRTPRRVTLSYPPGRTYRYKPEEVELVGRVVGRALTPAEAAPKPDDRELKLKRLRERLEKLDEEEDQILTCTERFKIEKQVYDLEREREQDEWPEYIGEGGGD